MVESQTLEKYLHGIAHALGTSSTALVRVERGALAARDTIGDLTLGAWIAPFLHEVEGDVIVCDGNVIGDTFGDALQARGIQFFAAVRLREGGDEFVCAYDAQRKKLTRAQRYVLQALATTLATHRELVDLRGRYREVVTSQATRDERLRLLESVVVNANDAVLITEASPVDEPGPRIRYANRAFTRATGYELSEIIGKTPRILQGPETSPEARMRLRASLLAWQPCEVELVNYRKDGTAFTVELSIVPVVDDTGQFTHWVSVQRDITERKAIEAQRLEARLTEAQHAALAYRAFHDDLTGLRNRAYFMERLGLVLREAAQAPQHRAAVFFLDLDRFKLINDSLGHRAGDLLLVEVAGRLARCLRPGDTLARMGGDEFTVLIERVRDLEGILEIASRIVDEFQAPVGLVGHEVYTSVSLGIAFVDARYGSAEDVLRDADSAMYRAKRDGGMRYVCFDDSMHAKAAAALALQMDLRRAVERDEFVVHYQPVIEMADGGLTGFEALVRWNHPERGLVHPVDFIDTAEETGLITPIGEFVLRQSCFDIGRWHVRFPSLTLNVNVSPRQFHSPNFYDVVVCALNDSGLAPRFLQLEITENLFLDREGAVGDMLRALRRLGIRIALDDFGTGYSSLSYLERFEVDTLKIDRSFVARIGTSSTGTAIVRTIVGLARALRMKVVGEGVETKKQFDVLRSFACDQGQGFLFGRAAEATGVERMLAAGRVRT